MTEWFYARNDQQYGPITFEQLVELARSGGLDPTRDSVWTAAMQDWTPAGQVPGLFDMPAIPGAAPGGASNPYAAPQSLWSDTDASDGIELEEIPPGSAPIDPMACVSRGFELIKRQFVNLFVIWLVYVVSLFGLSMVLNVVQQVVGFAFSRLTESPEILVGMTIAMLVISQVVMQFFTVFLQLGMIRAGLNLVSGKELSIGMLFGEGPKTLRAFGASLIFGVALTLGLLLLIVPGIYIACRYGQFMKAIVDRDLGVMESFSYSESITENNRFNLFVLGLLWLLLAIVGFLLCCVGLFFTMPLVWMSGMVAYRWMQYGERAAQDHPGTETPMLSKLSGADR
ncbi:MAG: DUF4339 domain-containing protein [Arenimonas sp.]